MQPRSHLPFSAWSFCSLPETKNSSAAPSTSFFLSEHFESALALFIHILYDDFVTRHSYIYIYIYVYKYPPTCGGSFSETLSLFVATTRYRERNSGDAATSPHWNGSRDEQKQLLLPSARLCAQNDSRGMLLDAAVTTFQQRPGVVP